MTRATYSEEIIFDPIKSVREITDDHSTTTANFLRSTISTANFEESVPATSISVLVSERLHSSSSMALHLW
jgi:hypothetical protein